MIVELPPGDDTEEWLRSPTTRGLVMEAERLRLVSLKMLVASGIVSSDAQVRAQAANCIHFENMVKLLSGKSVGKVDGEDGKSVAEST